MSVRSRFVLLFSIIGFISTLFSSCFKDEIVNTDPGFKLRFSTDSVFFDTTFTTIGSATKILKVFNDSKDPVVISEAKIRGSQGIHFTCNIDGIPGNDLNDIRIEAKDSIYVFCKVKVDPDQNLTESPFILNDFLDFTINSNTQSVVLVAWGQNANYITNKDNIGSQTLFTCDLGTVTWDDPKPYVIYGSLIIDECQLIIPEGARIYIHGGLVIPPGVNDAPFTDGRIFVGPRGQLTINGTAEKPVKFRGDRLEEEFKDKDGQWGGIVIFNSNRINKFSYLDLRNSNFGILADSATTLHLDHTIIDNVVLNCLIGNHATIKATNCLFSNSVGYNVVLTYGGTYNFDYCSIPNVSGQSFAMSLDNYTCDQDELGNCIKGSVRTNKAILLVRNSILSGLDDDEIKFVDVFEGAQPDQFQYSFTNSVLKVDDYQKDQYFQERNSNCIYMKRTDKIYVNENNSLFQLDSLSVARGIAVPIPTIQDDILGKIRKMVTPDAGCFEYLP